MQGSIAIINTVPDMSTGKIADGLLRYLKKQGETVYFCYGRGPRQANIDYYRIDYKIEVYIHATLSRLLGVQGAYSKSATKRLIRFLKEKNVRTIYGISLHGYYLNTRMFFHYLGQNDINFVYIMIDEAPYLGKCCYSADCMNFQHGCGNCPQIKEYPQSLFFDRSADMLKLKKMMYSELRHKVFVGPQYVIEKAKSSLLMKGIRTEIIDESIDLRTYYPRNTEQIRAELGLGDDKIILVCIAPSSYPRKGTRFFIELARKFENNSAYVFIHVGYTDSKNGLPNNYIAIGYEYDQDRLAQYYSLADLFIFPSLLDTMPNACLEAMACGSPLLCFNISGMPYIADDTTATFVEAGNVSQMFDVVKKISKKTYKTIEICRKYAESRYDNQIYCEKLYQCGKRLEENRSKGEDYT